MVYGSRKRFGGTRRCRQWPLSLVAALLLTACTGSPNPELDWGLRDDGWDVVYSSAEAATADMNDAGGTYSVPETAPVEGKQAHVGKVDVARLDAVSPAARPAHRAQSAAVSPHFAWPLRGKLLARFGTGAGGARNDGINIAAQMGEPIHAAADGTVGYAGSGIKGYGNLVLIRHPGNYFTAYAHADRVAVKVGEHVSAGQVIGYAGNTGDVTVPQLHFEIRRGKQPLNPVPYLSAVARS